MNLSNLLNDLKFVAIAHSAKYTIRQIDGAWFVYRNGERLDGPGHPRRPAARIAALKEADQRLEIAIMEEG